MNAIQMAKSEGVTDESARKVLPALTEAITQAEAKLAKASRWCALGIQSWDTGILLAPLDPADALTAAVRDFAGAAVGSGPWSGAASETRKATLELEALPGALAAELRRVTPTDLDPFLSVSLTRARGWGQAMELFSTVSLHVRPAKRV